MLIKLECEISLWLTEQLLFYHRLWKCKLEIFASPYILVGLANNAFVWKSSKMFAFPAVIEQKLFSFVSTIHPWLPRWDFYTLYIFKVVFTWSGTWTTVSTVIAVMAEMLALTKLADGYLSIRLCSKFRTPLALTAKNHLKNLTPGNCLNI